MLTADLETKPQPPRRAALPTAPAAARPTLRAGRLVLASLALTSLSLLAPSAPTYDPWSWIIWGREITQLDLVTTAGPSWKPLPVLFTTVFALFGGAAPSLWLVVARAGAVLAVVLAYALARDLGAGRMASAAGAAALAVAPWWTVNAWLGNSEGLLVTCVLGACLAHRRGSPRAAFALAVGAGLLRPEAWPFLGLYALWLARRDPRARRLVAGGLALLPLLWLVPEQLGSGDPWRASNRAQSDLPPDAAGSAPEPALEILRQAWALFPMAVWVAVFVAVGLAAVAGRRRAPGALPLTGLAAAWIALVAAMAAAGYSGNQRYLIAAAALLAVVAGVGAGGALARLPRLLVVPAAAAVLLLFAVPGARDALDARAETAAQSRLPGDLEGAIARAGGVQRLLRCGPVVTEPLLRPQVAWQLGLHLDEVDSPPQRRPALVLRAQASPHLRPYPDLAAYAGLAQRTLATAPRWRILAVGPCAR